MQSKKISQDVKTVKTTSNIQNKPKDNKVSKGCGNKK